MIDLHTHILPGIDDGARTMDDAIGMARAAVADGVRIAAATPHVRDDYPTPPEAMKRRLAELREALAQAEVPLDVRGGGEVAIDRLDRLSPEELARFGLGGNPAYVLLEFAYYGWPVALEPSVTELRARGVTVVVAHPERNADVQADPERLRPIVDAGALVQVTASSIDGRFGRRCRAVSAELVEHGLAHLIASDAHTPEIRGIGMSAAASVVHDDALVRWLTEGVPGAIVSGGPLPPRPPANRRRRRIGR